jgi:hypothetical protein
MTAADWPADPIGAHTDDPARVLRIVADRYVGDNPRSRTACGRTGPTASRGTSRGSIDSP